EGGRGGAAGEPREAGVRGAYRPRRRGRRRARHAARGAGCRAAGDLPRRGRRSHRRRRGARESGRAGPAGARRAGGGREVPALLERAPARRRPAASRAVRALRCRRRMIDARIRLAALVAVIVLVADQATKALVEATMRPHQSIDLLPFFALSYVRNTGAAFGVLA